MSEEMEDMSISGLLKATRDDEKIKLRDWFAGMAMQGMLSADVDNVAPSLGVVKAAYEYADQMLEERKK